MTDVVIYPDIGVAWSQSEHANGETCCRCDDRIYLNGYAPRLTLRGKPLAYIGPALATCCICAACIDEEDIAHD